MVHPKFRKALHRALNDTEEVVRIRYLRRRVREAEGKCLEIDEQNRMLASAIRSYQAQHAGEALKMAQEARAAQDQELAKLRAQVTTYLEREGPALQRHRDMLCSEIDRLRGQLAGKDAEITSLQQNLAEVTHQRDHVLEQFHGSEDARAQEQALYKEWEQSLIQHHVDIQERVIGIRDAIRNGPMSDLLIQMHGNLPGDGVAEEPMEEEEEQEEEEPEEEPEEEQEEEEPEEEPEEEQEEEIEEEEPEEAPEEEAVGPESEDEGQVDD